MNHNNIIDLYHIIKYNKIMNNNNNIDLYYIIKKG